MSHSVEWRHDGRRILLPVLALQPAPSTDLTGLDATALLDTGSTTTGITPRVAETLGLTPRGKRPMGSIHGEGQAERFVFRIGIRLADAEPSFPFVFDDVEGFELRESFQLDILLGMDILKQCDFKMSSTGECRLSFGR